jgi:hypothetical protein
LTQSQAQNLTGFIFQENSWQIINGTNQILPLEYKTHRRDKTCQVKRWYRYGIDHALGEIMIAYNTICAHTERANSGGSQYPHTTATKTSTSDNRIEHS